MPRLAKDSVIWMRSVFERNRAAHTKSVIFVHLIKARGALFQLYILCKRVLGAMNVRLDLNGAPHFSRHSDVHLTFSENQLSTTAISPPSCSGHPLKYRVVQVTGGDVSQQIMYYTETWFTQAMWEDYVDSLPDPPRCH